MKLYDIFLFVFAIYLSVWRVDGNVSLNVAGLTAEEIQQLLIDAGAIVEDLDECAKTVPVCPADSECGNSVGSYSCTCLTGFDTVTDDTHGATECTDKDECAAATNPCATISGSVCQNNEGSYECECQTGYAKNTAATACEDIDECGETGICSSSGPSICENLEGSFECNCENGYEKDEGGVCQNIDECEVGTHLCLTNQVCTDADGSHTCPCKVGYKESDTQGEDCVDKNECTEDGDDPCPSKIPGSSCVNNEGSYKCLCTQTGYHIVENLCVDIDECDTMVMEHDCSTNEVCINEAPGYKCECAEGYTGDPADNSCSDENECNKDPCDTNALCVNMVGRHECFCNEGYYGSGEKNDCIDVLSCTTFNSVKAAILAVQNAAADDDVTTHRTTLTQYASASGKAAGVPGDTYRDALVGTIDADIANVIDKLRCDYFSSCSAVTDGSGTSYTCNCDGGYISVTDSDTQCIDIDECSPTPCDETAKDCVNNQGSYNCICEGGYKLSGGTNSNCIDIDECSDGTHNCHSDATCTNLVPSFNCQCNEGFFGTGIQCQNSKTCPTFNSVKNAIDLIRSSASSDSEEYIAASTLLTQYVATTGISPTVPRDTYDELFSPAAGTLEANAASLLICDYKSNCGTDEDGDIFCTCHDGYTKTPSNPNQCTDVNECSALDNACVGTGACMNNEGGFSCDCNSGYQGGQLGPCTDVDECSSGNHECGDTGTCENIDGTYKCACIMGYEGGGAAAACTNINECLTSPGPCDTQATCTDKNGSYDCKCNDGYAGSGVACEDVDECAEPNLNTCDANADCSNTEGTYVCACKSGFMGTGQAGECTDVLSCSTFASVKTAIDSVRNALNGEDVTTHTTVLQQYASAVGKAEGVSGDTYRAAFDGTIDADIEKVIDKLRCDYFSTCDSNTDGTVTAYTCSCSTGYEYVTDSVTQCMDVDECADDATCGDGATCGNKQGSYMCTCDSGFELSGGISSACVDVDECATADNNCNANAQCTNGVGSFSCSCNGGFEGNGIECTDVDECATADNNCNANAQCTNGVGSFSCSCNGGFEGNGIECTDVDECATADNNCNANAQCTNGVGSFSCSCNGGFEGNGIECTDVDECATADNNCNANAQCTNGVGSFSCSCNGGFEGNGIECTDVDECATADNNCNANAQCTNGVGSFSCSCNGGFEGNGIECTDVDECATADNNCNANAQCTNGVGSFSCSCNGGFEGNGIECTDVDECATADNNCNANAQCTNGVGSFSCSCNGGFEGNGIECTDVDECATADNNCNVNAQCTNEIGSFSCSCNGGFEGNGIECTDIDECTTDDDDCHIKADCTNTPGSFTCKCMDGYLGSGKTCSDHDECANEDDHGCDDNAVCDNIDGGHTCTCKTEYFGDGTLGNCKSVTTCGTYDNIKAAIDTVRTSSDSTQVDDARTTLKSYAEATGLPTRTTGGSYRFAYGTSDVDINSVIDHLLCDYHATCSEEGDGSTTCSCMANFISIADDFKCFSILTCGVFDAVKTAISAVRTETIDNPATAEHKILQDYASQTGFADAANQALYNMKYPDSNEDVTNALKNLRCDFFSTCNFAEDAYTCTCETGYEQATEPNECQDVDECTTADDNCNANAQCTNDVGSYSCSCNGGFEGNGIECTDVDECTTADNNCNANAQCTNDVGSFSCSCNGGFEGNGIECTDVDECTTADNNCNVNAQCTNDVGSFTCSCRDGFEGNGIECTDVDECATADNNCNVNAQCTNDVGSFSCSCNGGFEGNGIECTDVDECATTDSNCDANAQCRNDIGSFTCSCNDGFEGNGIECTDSMECTTTESTLCGSNAVCTDTVGSYACSCSEGFDGDGAVCMATNACLFAGDSVGANDSCDGFDHPLSCSFERALGEIAGKHFQEYRAFFEVPGELRSKIGASRAATDFTLIGTNTNDICKDITTYTSPDKAYSDLEQTTEVELFSSSCYRQWFVVTQCDGVPEHINVACNTEYLPRLALVVRKTGDKYEIAPEFVYLPSCCKLSASMG